MLMKKLLKARNFFCLREFTHNGSWDVYYFKKRLFRIPFVSVLLLAAVIRTTAMAADYQVTTLNDGGVGSLRTALGAARDGDTIFFAPGLTGPITLASALPELYSITFVNAKEITLTWSDLFCIHKCKRDHSYLERCRIYDCSS